MPTTFKRRMVLTLIMVIVFAPLHGAFANTIFNTGAHHFHAPGDPTTDPTRHHHPGDQRAVGETNCAHVDLDCCGVCIPVMPGGKTEFADFGAGVPRETTPSRITQRSTHPLLRPPIS